jgi:predicted secreted protein
METQWPQPLYKHSSRALLFSAALLLLSCSPSQADLTIVTPSDSDRNATNLHLTYRADRLIARDLAHIELRVEVAGNDPRAIEAELNRRMTAALAHARKSEGTTVQVGAFAVVRQTPTSFPRAVPGVGFQAGADANTAMLAAAGEWKAAQLITLDGRDMRGLVRLVTQLQQDGAIISDTRFDVSPETLAAVRQELTTEGLAKLRAEAQQVAGDMGMQIERYRNLDVAAPYPEVKPARFIGVQPASFAGLTTLQAGEMDVSVIVNANVALMPKLNP